MSGEPSAMETSKIDDFVTLISQVMPMRLFASLFVLAVSGCAGFRFSRTDPSFPETKRAELPQVFLEGVPPAFRSVGLIELVVAGDIDPDALRSEAAGAGQQLGCDVVVSAALVTRLTLREGVVLAQHCAGGDAPARGGGGDTAASGGARGGTSGGQEGRGITRPKAVLFHCGVLVPERGT